MVGFIALGSFGAALLLVHRAWWRPRRLTAECERAVRALEASRMEEARALLERLRVEARGPLGAAVEFNLGVSALRAGRHVEARRRLTAVIQDPQAPTALVHAALCHAAIVSALSGETAEAELLLARAQTVARSEAVALPLVAASPEVYRLAEAVVWLYARGTLPSALLAQTVNVVALDAHSMTGLRVLRAYARHLAGDAEPRVLEELLAVAEHGRPQEFAYLTAGIPRLRSFLLTRAA